MRALPILFFLAAACGGVPDRGACSASTDCPAGAYCARTSDGNVCWPDAVAPTVTGVVATCGACLRDGTVRVEATIADDVEVASAEVTVGLGTPTPMARAGGIWTADVPLAELPFPHFEADLVATVTARDAARNVTEAGAASAVHITRLRFETPFGAGLEHPSVAGDGTIAVPANNGRVFLATWDGDVVASVSIASGAPQILTAPLALGASVWVGGEDNKVYELSSGGAWVAVQRVTTGGAVRGSLALTADGYVIATSASGAVYAVTSSTSSNAPPRTPIVLGATVDHEGSIYVVSGSSVRRLTVTGLGFLVDDPSFASTIGSPVFEPLAASSGLTAVASDGANGLVRHVLATGGDPQHVATTGVPSGGVAIANGGDILVPEETKKLTRWSSTGVSAAGWSTPDLGGAPRTPLLLASGDVPLVVSTAAGAVHALRPDGTIAWTGQFGTAALQPGNIYTRPGQVGPILSTAYFAGADGVLHAVIVDGELDRNAPWPKAFHDPRNTNRAGAQP